MTDGFSNPIIGGGGALVYPSVRSPNYVPGHAGWSVNKNGTAQFNAITTYGELTILAPSNDPTGVTDSASLATAFAAANSVQLLPGIFYLASPLQWSFADLFGEGDSSTVTIQPGSSWAGAALLEPGSGASVHDLRGYGGSGIRSANPAANFIQTQPGAQWWKVRDIRCDQMNGNIIQCAPITASHGTIRTVKGEHNAGGIRIDNGTGGSVTAEINISDLDIQNCEVSEVLFLSAVTDILCAGPVNGSVKAGVAANGITVQGACQTCHLLGLDVGGGAGTGICVLQAAGGNSPTDIWVSGKLQSGTAGLVVNDSTARSRFDVWCTRNQGDGAQFNGTAKGLRLLFAANLNNQGAGVAYDVNVTSTAHVLIDGPAYDVGGPVTANLNIALAGNHVSEVSPPAGRTTAGNAPAGW